MVWRSRLTRIFKIALVGVFVLSVIFGLNEAIPSHYFPIKTVRVYGINHLDQQEIKDATMPFLKQGFFGVNVALIKERLLKMPWVSTIFVKRHWPDQIEMTIIEKNAVACWNKEMLLSDKGEIFMPKPESFPNQLPQFVGPLGKQLAIFKHYSDMNRILAPLHAKISYLELTPFLTWKLILDNGMSLQVSHKESLTRLDRFVKVYDKIVGNRAADVEYIDLRYSNGMAVRWRENRNA